MTPSPSRPTAGGPDGRRPRGGAARAAPALARRRRAVDRCASSARSACSAGSSSTPTLIGLFVGRWLDHSFGTGIFWSAPLLMVGRGARLLVGLAMDAQPMTAAAHLSHGAACARRRRWLRRRACTSSRCAGTSALLVAGRRLRCAHRPAAAALGADRRGSGRRRDRAAARCRCCSRPPAFVAARAVAAPVGARAHDRIAARHQRPVHHRPGADHRAGGRDLGAHGRAGARRRVWPTRRLSLAAVAPQAALELMVDAIDGQIRDTMRVDAGALPAAASARCSSSSCAANWSSLVPGVEPPTAHIETDAALALIVFFAVIYFGVRARGRRRLSQDLRRADLLHDAAQHRRDLHPHLLADGPPVRQHHERRLHRRHRAVAGRPARADPADGARSADRRRPGLHLHRARHGLHRRRGQRTRIRKRQERTTS